METTLTLIPMFRVIEQSTIASVTDLRRRTSDIMDRADEGDVVVVQRDNEPHGVYLSYRHYESLVEKLNRLESLELALIALPRKAAIDSGEMGTTSLADMIAEFAPELAEKPAVA
jgi:prevent-host-death family protein